MDINTLFHEALLAQAAYADLDANMTKEALITKLQDNFLVGGVTQAQAEYFADHFKVVQQDNNPETGFSATLFQEIKKYGELGEYHLATRGSAPPPSWDLDFNVDWTGANLQNYSWGMAYDQVADLINFYLRLTQTGNVPQFTFEKQILDPRTLPPEGSVFRYHEYNDDTQEPTADVYLVFKQKLTGEIGFGEISNTKKLNVSGHSLGGHLASAFSLLFPSVINQTSTFDSAGIIGAQFDELASAIGELIEIQQHKVENPNVNVIDFKAPLDTVANPALWSTTHLSGQLSDVFIEVGADGDSHSIDKLVDSLAVMNLLYTLDSSITLPKANELLPLGSDDANTELEGMMIF